MFHLQVPQPFLAVTVSQNLLVLMTMVGWREWTEDLGAVFRWDFLSLMLLEWALGVLGRKTIFKHRELQALFISEFWKCAAVVLQACGWSGLAIKG